MAWGNEEVAAVRALRKEKGGALLLEHLQAEVDAIHRAWAREIRPFDKGVPDERKLLLKKIKHQADLEAYGRVIALMTDPEEERQNA